MVKSWLAVRVTRAAGVFVGLTFALVLHAAPVSYTGTFSHDNDLRFFAPLDITSPTGGTISGQTFSHSGGINAAGSLIAGGGFIPALVLFDSTGTELQRTTAVTSTCGGPPFCFDIAFNFNLAMGSYLLVLTQDGNLPTTGILADGYIYDSDSTYTSMYSLGGPTASFVQFDGDQRDGHWALDIDIANNFGGNVPEPSSLALAVAALGASIAVRRRRAD